MQSPNLPDLQGIKSISDKNRYIGYFFEQDQQQDA
jgi:hypothetical protein